MGTDRKPPTSAEELLERYAAGERDFTGAQLPGADLADADLVGVKLSYANLSNATLAGADLAGADLVRAILLFTDFRDANLPHARLSGASFVGAYLGGATLENAKLFNAVLKGAVLTEANLSGAHLGGADLSGATLDGAIFSGVHLATTLLNVDLSVLCCVDPPVIHEGQSAVDYRTIVRSLRASGLKEFLVRAGTPELFAEQMVDCARSLDPEGVFKLLQSTFISYGGPDTDFAQKLNDALLRNAVTTFFFAKDAVPGKKLHRLMRDGVNQHDRVILVCSKASLDRPGVLNEVTETLQREFREGGKEYLIPITLDDYVFAGWKPEDPGVAQAIRDRVVADFRGAHTDKAKFDEGVLKLIAALKK